MSEIRHVATAPTHTRRLASGEDVYLHHHDDHQLIYASAGVLEVVLERGTWFTPPTRAVWVAAGTVHHWQVHGNATVHLVGVPRSLRPDVADRPELVVVRPLFRELMIACAEAGPATSPAGQRLLQVLIDHVTPAPEPVTMLPALQDERLRKVAQIVESDLTVSNSLVDLGTQVGASGRTLSRLFRDRVGMSFRVWRNQLRLHRANLLLAEGQSVTAVASACGYSSPSSFITVFRAAFGRTPGSVYR